MFASKKDVKLFVCSKSVADKKPFVVERSNSKRHIVTCKADCCSFRMSFFKRADGLFHLVEERPHSCNCLKPTVKKVWLRREAKEFMKEFGRLSPKELAEKFLTVFKIAVDDVVIRRALNEDKEEESQTIAAFGLVEDFLDTLSSFNNGTTTCMLKPDGFFKRAFLFPGICVEAFAKSTKVVGLDACHIKARYGGVLLVLTVLDGDGHVFPAAIGIAESENQETWRWFVCLVRQALRIEDGGIGIVVLSDREKGIDIAVREYLPCARHAFCVYHIQKNVKMAFKTSLEGLLFKAAKLTSVKEFKETIEEMKKIDIDAGEYIEKIDPTKWARAFFPAPRFGHVTSNISESMNWWLEEARHKDPVGLFSLYIFKLNVLLKKYEKSMHLFLRRGFQRTYNCCS